MKRQKYNSSAQLCKMIDLFTIIFTCIPTILLWSFSAYAAAPSISSVSGSVIQGQNLVISGKYFGTKSPVTPWLYDDFESGASNGLSATGRSSTVGNHSWQYYDMNGGGGPTNYDNSQNFNGNYSVTEINGGNGNNLWVGGQATQQRYVSYRFRYSGNLTGGYVWKFDRTTSGLNNQGNENPPYDAFPNFGFGNLDGGYFNNGDGNFYNYKGWPTVGAANTWHRIEDYFTMSTKGVSNGTMQIWVDNLLNTNYVNNLMTCSNSASVCQIDTWMMPLMANDTSSLQTWVDDVYIDNTLARIEVCDSPTWANRTKCVLQIPNTTWNDNTIQAKVVQGQFGSGAVAYLFVIDGSGNVSNGQPITFGSGGSPPPPTVVNSPTGLKIVTTLP